MKGVPKTIESNRLSTGGVTVKITWWIITEGTAHYRALFPMACCELVKVKLTIIII